jgi:MFS family permease
VLTVPVVPRTQGIFSGIFFSALGPLLSEVVPLSDFSDALSIIWLVSAPITLASAPIAFALDEYSKSGLGRTGPEIFQIAIGTAGGANIVAAIALFVVKRFQRKEQDM